MDNERILNERIRALAADNAKLKADATALIEALEGMVESRHIIAIAGAALDEYKKARLALAQAKGLTQWDRQ